jgi:hypothetical protein
MRIFWGRRIILVGAMTLALLGVGAGAAVAALTFKFGTSVSRVSVMTEDNAATFTSTAFTTVGTTSIFATAGSHIVVTFSAESDCNGTAGSWCSARILVGGVEADPVVGTDFAFDHVAPFGSWESLSMQRVRTVTTSATHTVQIQVAMATTGITQRLDDWVLSAWAINP